jgi:hypothetical protein
MRSNIVSRLAVACATVVALVLSTGALAQQYGNYFINHGTPGSNNSGLRVWLAECKTLDLKSNKPQTLSCTLTPSSNSNTCQPCYGTDAKSCTGGNICSFVANSTDQAPSILVFGRSSTNPTCGYVYDPTQGRYMYRCW